MSTYLIFAFEIIWSAILLVSNPVHAAEKTSFFVLDSAVKQLRGNAEETVKLNFLGISDSSRLCEMVLERTGGLNRLHVAFYEMQGWSSDFITLASDNSFFVKRSIVLKSTIDLQHIDVSISSSQGSEKLSLKINGFNKELLSGEIQIRGRTCRLLERVWNQTKNLFIIHGPLN